MIQRAGKPEHTTDVSAHQKEALSKHRTVSSKVLPLRVPKVTILSCSQSVHSIFAGCYFTYFVVCLQAAQYHETCFDAV